MLLLFLANGKGSVRISDMRNWNLHKFLLDPMYESAQPLVNLGIYTLMPNHFHLLLQEVQAGGLALFMRKVCTGYSMYFNTKYQRTGTLMSNRYKSKPITDDAYLQMVVPYIHLNPAELFDPAWKKGTASLERVEKGLQSYHYSSLPDYLGIERLEKKIIGKKLFTYFDRMPTFEDMVQNAQEYYAQNASFLS